MIKILIHGIKDGQHDISLDIPTDNIDGLEQEFFGTVHITGKLIKVANRFSFIGLAKCDAKLICDRTLKEYVETIIAELNISFISDNRRFALLDDSNSSEDEIIVREDEKHFDLSDEVRQQLAINIPMKKLSPDVADKEFEEIFPEIASDKSDKVPDERWALLKNLKIN